MEEVWKRCHYCPATATTRDHIVPRSETRPRKVRPGEKNIVPACQPCNKAKASKPSACRCQRCESARMTYGSPEWRAGAAWTPGDHSQPPSPAEGKEVWCFVCETRHVFRRAERCRNRLASA